MLRKFLLPLAASSLAFTSLPAEITSVSLKINGLLCPHCLPIVTEALEDVDVVDQVTIHPRTGLSKISIKEGKSINLQKLEEAVESAGYKIGKIEAEIIGEVIKSEGYFVFKSRGDHSRFLLYTYEWDHGELVTTTKGELEEELSRYGEDSQFLRIEGRLHHHVGQLPGFSVERLWPVADEEGED